MVLARDPLCNCNQPATEVDHIVPKSAGGSDSMENLQGLCKPCHSRKTAYEGRWEHTSKDGELGKITLVCGPPGSGKSEFVKSRMKWGDLKVDAMYEALSGLPYYEKPDVLLPFVTIARDAIVNRLISKSNLRHGWLITSGPHRSQRDRYKTRFLGRINIVVLEVPVEECVRRIANDERRSDKADLWRPLVQQWWRDYEKG